MAKFNLLEKAMNWMGYMKATRISEIFESQDFINMSVYGNAQPSNYGKYLEAYRNEVWVYACTYIIANSIAQLPFKIYRDIKTVNKKTGQTEFKKVEVENHPIIDLFNKPNVNDENSTFYNMIEWTSANLDLIGNAYWLLDKINSKGIPGSIHLLLGSRIRVIPNTEKDKETFIKHYEYTLNNGQKIIFSESDILHFRYMAPDDYLYGVGSFSPGRWSADLIKESQKTNLNIFKNGAQVGGVMQTDKKLDNDVYNRLLKQLNQRYAGTSNAHKTMLLEQGLKYQKAFGTMVDLEYIEGNKLSREEICGVFGVPPLLVGILDKASYANYNESKKIFWEFTLLPKIVRLEQFIDTLMLRYNDKAYFQFDLSSVDVLKEAEFDRAKAVREYWNMGVPFNQLIEIFDLPMKPVPGGDVGYLPFSLMPTTQLAVRALPQEQAPVEEPEEERSSGSESINKEFKGIIPTYTKEKKYILWKQFDQQSERLENGYMRVIQRFFTDLERQVLRNLDRSKSMKQIEIDAILYDEDEVVQAWTVTSNKVHKISVSTNAKRELRNLGISGSVFDVENPRVERLIRNYSLDKSKEVIGSNREVLQNSLADGFAQGEGIPELSKRVKDVYDPYKQQGYKAERIARTEIISTSNRGALEAYREAKVEKKAWLPTFDDRVRDGHLLTGNTYSEANAIPTNKDFILEGTGNRCQHPGGTGAAEDDINCRCTIIPVIEI